LRAIRFGFGELAGEISGELEQADLFSTTSNCWSHNNLQELNKSLEMALGCDAADRMASPDSGIDPTDCIDFDIEGCSLLLGNNDPILNTAEREVSEEEEEGLVEETVNSSQYIPVIDYESLELVSPMESEEEAEEEQQQQQEEEDDNTHLVNIHSYSVLKIKKPEAMKRKTSRLTKRKVADEGAKYRVTVRGKKKMYELGPLSDPVAERNRQNALNAKKNRDRKKRELEAAEQEIGRLREENDELREEADTAKDELAAARLELENLRNELRSNGIKTSLLGKRVPAMAGMNL